MAKPVTVRFGRFFVRLSDGNSPAAFVAPCGFTSKAFNRSKTLGEVNVPDCDDPDAPAWVERDVQNMSATISGSGVLAKSAVPVWEAALASVESIECEVELEYPDGDNLIASVREGLSGSTRAAPVAPFVRRFDGAAGGRRGHGMGTFGPINSEVAAAGQQLRPRSRYLTANHTLVGSGVRNLTTALTGTGIVPTSRAKSKAARRRFARDWETFCRQVDADGRTDFYGLQAAIARALVVDGEAFVQILDGPQGWPRLRQIPSEMVDESMTRPVDGGGYIVQGIEFAADGTRVACWVHPARPTDLFATAAPPVRIPASEMLHIFEPIAAGQVRGVSWLAPVILSASEFDQLCDALLVGTKVAAMFAGFLTNQNDTTGADPFDGESAPSLEPGTVQRLGGGWDIKFATPAQAQQTGEFVKAQIRQLAAGLGVPSHWLDGDLTGANYSSLRAGLLPVRARAEQVQYLTLVPQLLNPIWREVFPDDQDGADWLPPAWQQVDPAKQVEADAAELAAGLTSRRKLVAARGWAIEDLDAEIAADSFTPAPAAPKKEEKPDE